MAAPSPARRVKVIFHRVRASGTTNHADGRPARRAVRAAGAWVPVDGAAVHGASAGEPAGERAAGETTGEALATASPFSATVPEAPQRASRHAAAAPREPRASDRRPARRTARRRARGVWARPATLVAATAAALVLGVGAGAASQAISGLGGAEAALALVATPQQCAVAQVAWTQSANAQVRLDAADPASLRSGFLGARDALDEATAPPAVAEDWDVVESYVDALAAAVEPLDPADGEAVSAAVGQTIGDLDGAAMSAAAARVTAYLKADCAP